MKRVITWNMVTLDGFDKPADREHGTGELLDALGRALRSGAAQPQA